MTIDLRIAATALALILAPIAAAAHHKAGHDGGNGNGHAAHEDRGGGRAFGHDRAGRAGDEEDGEDTVSRDHPCAPGLAGREPACVPPGQAAHGVTTEDWIGAPTDRYAVGDSVEAEDFGWVVNADRLGLDPLEDGQRYALIDDTIVVVDEATYEILEIVRRAAIPGRSAG